MNLIEALSQYFGNIRVIFNQRLYRFNVNTVTLFMIPNGSLGLLHTVRFFLIATAICFLLTLGYIGVGDVFAVASCEHFQ